MVGMVVLSFVLLEGRCCLCLELLCSFSFRFVSFHSNSSHNQTTFRGFALFRPSPSPFATRTDRPLHTPFFFSFFLSLSFLGMWIAFHISLFSTSFIHAVHALHPPPHLHHSTVVTHFDFDLVSSFPLFCFSFSVFCFCFVFFSFPPSDLFILSYKSSDERELVISRLFVFLLV